MAVMISLMMISSVTTNLAGSTLSPSLIQTSCSISNGMSNTTATQGMGGVGKSGCRTDSNRGLFTLEPKAQRSSPCGERPR